MCYFIISIIEIHSSSTPLPLIRFTSEEITGSTNEAAKGANKFQRNLPSCCFFFFILCFTVSVTLSLSTPESSNDCITLIISFISLFEINKVNPFPALTATFPLIFLPNLFVAFEVKFLTNPGKLSLTKGIAIFVSAVFPKLPNQGPKDPRD